MSNKEFHEKIKSNLKTPSLVQVIVKVTGRNTMFRLEMQEIKVSDNCRFKYQIVRSNMDCSILKPQITIVKNDIDAGY